MILKIHENQEKKIVAVCDSELKGKKFEEGKLQLDLTSHFYDGQEADETKILNSFKNAYMVNLVGQKSVDLAIKAGIAEKENVIKIDSIPHVQAILE
ncbi:MAG: DUF424 family protein [Candidatus Woesearchaeota archaeon]|jgi:hypothetical protein|nr:DUF424 family protein [Candidatus Woesearchaeota archaeon]